MTCEYYTNWSPKAVRREWKDYYFNKNIETILFSNFYGVTATPEEGIADYREKHFVSILRIRPFRTFWDNQRASV